MAIYGNDGVAINILIRKFSSNVSFNGLHMTNEAVIAPVEYEMGYCSLLYTGKVCISESKKKVYAKRISFQDPSLRITSSSGNGSFLSEISIFLKES